MSKRLIILILALVIALFAISGAAVASDPVSINSIEYRFDGLFGEFYAIETMRGTLFSHFLIQLAVMLVASCMLGVMLGLLILPALTEARLLRLAGEELAEALVILLPKEITCELSMLSNRGILLGIVAFLCAMIAAVRKYQFVYDEKE